ncbi:hypothetical protein JHW43_008315 [Diplocarpon mali]|nr:hypothetical protein JHW43_008315 [Diplocarpon mali]
MGKASKSRRNISAWHPASRIPHPASYAGTRYSYWSWMFCLQPTLPPNIGSTSSAPEFHGLAVVGSTDPPKPVSGVTERPSQEHPGQLCEQESPSYTVQCSARPPEETPPPPLPRYAMSSVGHPGHDSSRDRRGDPRAGSGLRGDLSSETQAQPAHIRPRAKTSVRRRVRAPRSSRPSIAARDEMGVARGGECTPTYPEEDPLPARSGAATCTDCLLVQSQSTSSRRNRVACACSGSQLRNEQGVQRPAGFAVGGWRLAVGVSAYTVEQLELSLQLWK